MIVIAWLLLAVPFAFGLIRLVTTGDDWRYLAVALASTLGASAALMRLRPAGASTLVRALGAGTAAAISAAVIAATVGARSGPAIAVVSIGFAVCSASGAVLYAWSRDARSR